METEANIAREVASMLDSCDCTIAVAESCTGGLVAKLLTDQPNSSAYFLGGIVAYSDAIKSAILGVGIQDLQNHGAVSDVVVRAMARGCRRLFSADCAIAVTGIAGPSGGSVQKPVGTVFVAINSKHGEHVEQFSGSPSASRQSNRSFSAAKALCVLRGHVHRYSNQLPN